MSGQHHDHASDGHSHGHDAWHHHNAAEGGAQVPHGAVTSIAAMARGLLLIAVSTLGLVGVTMLYLNHHINQLHRVRADADLSADYVEYRDGTKKRMGDYGWVDANTPHVPVDIARDRVLKKYESAPR